MGRLHLVCLAALTASVLAGAGCGSDDDDDTSPGGDAGEAGETSSATGGGAGETSEPTGGSQAGGEAGATDTGGSEAGGAAGSLGTAGEAGQVQAGGTASDGGAGGAAAGQGGAGGATTGPVVITASVISGGAVWTAGTYVLEDSLSVEDGVLEVEACSVIRLPADGTISVTNGGALRLIGTEACPITITSISEVPQRGDWGYIEFDSTADGGNNQFDWVVVEYGGGLNYGALWFGAGSRLQMKNTAVRQSAHFAMQLQDGVALPGFSGNTLTTSALGPIELFGNDVGQLTAGTYDGNDVNEIHVAGGYVTTNQTWGDWGVPYMIASTVEMSTTAGSAHLTLAPGTTLRFGDDIGLTVGNLGGLTAAGTTENPITFTSAKATPAPGDWDEIEFYAESSDAQNRLENVVVEYGGSLGYGQVWVDGGASVQITDSSLTNSAAYGLLAYEGAELRSFTGNTLTDNAEAPVALAAEQVAQLGAGTYTPNAVEGINVSEGATVSTNATWLNLGVPYLLPDGLALEAATGSAHLTVEAGTALWMGPNVGISVGTNGGLTLAGTTGAHVTVTSAKAAPAAGDWAEIDIYADSNGPWNVFTFTDIMYGGSAGYGQLWLEDGGAVQLNDVVFSNASCDVYLGGTSTPTGNSTYVTCP